MSTINLTRTTAPAGGTPEDVVIVQFIDGYRGGRALDVSGFEFETLRSGHLIIQDDSTRAFKPLQPKADGSGYEDKPAGHSFVGVLVGSLPRHNPQASILTRGTVNPEACPFPMSDELIETLKTALPHIQFLKD